MMIRTNHAWLFAAVWLLGWSVPVPRLEARAAQEPTEAVSAADRKADETTAEQADPIARIREEGFERSQVMETLDYLTNVIGPRLTNSPGMTRANEWTRDTLASWGCENASLEAWGDFGRGWELKRFSLQMVEPQCVPLFAAPKAWSPGTDGPIRGRVVALEIEDEADLERYRGQLDGAMVLVGRLRELESHWEPLARRFSAEQLLEMANAPDPDLARRLREQARDNERPRREPSDERIARYRAARELAAKRDQFLIEENVAALIDASPRGDAGAIFVSSASVPRSFDSDRRVRAWDPDAPEMLPQVRLTADHYNRLARMLKHGVEPILELDMDVQFHDETTAYNTIAEIPGGDPSLKDEIVMLGGHLDSWHSSPGATDNAAGCAVAMEAVRILLALDLKPRRTIRIALWSGEEQGLHGSRNYVAQHFGAREDGELKTTKEYEDFSAYYNLDNGTGKIRGVYLQGNEAVRPIFREWLAAFEDLEATTITARNTGGTDHLPFDAIGLPGFQFIQDPIEYGSRTHHSNIDTYDRLQEEDLKQAAVIMAAFVYQTAMRDECLPRKPLNQD